MRPLHELITHQEADQILLVLALLFPAVGIGFYYFGGRRRVLSFLIGVFGLFNLAMWHLYELITEHLGLDTVRNVAVNAAIFILIGLCVGAAVGKLLKAGPAVQKDRGENRDAKS